jgi:hypothetical protein
MWPIPDDMPRQTCIDCPACGGHYLVDEGAEWCFMCTWELRQVEQHSGPPVETGFKVGDMVRWCFSEGRIRYIDPSGFVEILSGGWTIRIPHDELDEVYPVQEWQPGPFFDEPGDNE